MSFTMIKQTYGQKAKLCYMDTDSFIACIETEKVKEIK